MWGWKAVSALWYRTASCNFSNAETSIMNVSSKRFDQRKNV